MSKQILTSAKKAVRKAYAKAGILYGSFGALATGLYLNTQRIAESYVPGGIWNPEAWGQQSWGFDGFHACASLGGAILLGAITALGAPTVFKTIYDMGNTKTELDVHERKITQTRPRFFDKNGTYFARKEDSLEYDAILSIKVNQGPLQRKANTGNLEITAIRLDEAEEKELEGDSKLVKINCMIPYQETPFNVKEEIFEGLPTHNALKKGLRSGVIPS